MCDFTEMTSYIVELRAAQTTPPSPATAAATPGGVATPFLPEAVVGDPSLEHAA